METVIKSIPIQNGKLFTVVRNSRYLLAKCKAEMEIIEVSDIVPALGKCRVIKNRNVAILVTVNHEFVSGLELDSLAGFSFQGDLLRKDGKYVKMNFDNCLLSSDLDLTDSGEYTFEVQCSQEFIRTLQNL